MMGCDMIERLMRPRRFRCLTLFLAAALWSPAAARAQQEAVRVGYVPIISNAGVYIAIERGYLREQGIGNEMSTFASAAKMLSALAVGELDVSLGAASAGLFNAIADGAPFRIVADKGQARAGTGFSLLTVRKALVDSGEVKSVKDLKGKKVAIYAKGNVHEYMLAKMADEVGLTLQDFDLTYIDAPRQLAAYESKAIDAAIIGEPWASRFEDVGLAVKFRTPDQVKGLGAVQIACIMYSGKFIKERRPVAQRWMDAYLKGAKFYVEKGVKDDEVAAIIEKYTKVPAKVVKTAIPHYQEPEGRPSLESLADQIQWHVTNGRMPKPVPVDQVVDLSFLR